MSPFRRLYNRLIQKPSVLFLHQSYYHFYYLAQALRLRGWDALTVSLEDPESPNAKYYHGSDVNLYSPDPVEFKKNILEFYEEALRRFRLLHFAGDGLMSFFPEHWNHGAEAAPDILKWREQGKKIAYTVSGCSSAVSQSSVARWSGQGGAVVCNVCPWRSRPEVCSDPKNLSWGKKVNQYCDLVFGETVPALDYLDSPKVVREPTTMCLDSDFWNPGLEVPEEHRVSKAAGELLVYHAMGNHETRTVNGRNIKGSHAVIQAVEQLQSEKVPVRLLFVTDRKNTEIRFYQAQADVIVDQLNYGRYGATAREGMMLGKPVICYLNRHEMKPRQELVSMREVPLVSATEASITEVLRNLLLNEAKRKEIGRASREYALKWHSAEGCAERYEKITENLWKGRLAEYPFPRPSRCHVRP
ncbi:MAG: hypothetical protein HYU36_01535 [Planctomycetes bacterium]|nr:hypothetical protein [Planctomycetota bacterium]